VSCGSFYAPVKNVSYEILEGNWKTDRQVGGREGRYKLPDSPLGELRMDGGGHIFTELVAREFGWVDEEARTSKYALSQ
jgi:hypothetical protein